MTLEDVVDSLKQIITFLIQGYTTLIDIILRWEFILECETFQQGIQSTLIVDSLTTIRLTSMMNENININFRNFY